MKLKQSSIRPKGQRSIQSTAMFRSGTSGCDKNVSKAGDGNGSRVSLSEFLSRKLHRNSVLPGLAKGKESSLFPAGSENVSSVNRGKGKEETREEEGDVAIDIVLQQFKHTKNEIGNASSVGDDEPGTATTNDSRKRKQGDHVECPKKRMAVLGDDSGVKRGRVKKNMASNDQPKDLFNHYANGGGWWDYNMEGVDNEEVGSAEVWEGMGSTTLGGLDWN